MIARRLWAGAACAAATTAAAHGFGERYDLPLPLVLYVCGAALTVLLTCVMLLVFVRAAPSDRPYPRIELLRYAPLRALASPPAIALLRLAAVAFYCLVIVAGLVGTQSPFRNMVPITVWALWWVGMAYVSALALDLWRIVNPLETLFAAAERAWLRVSGRPLSRGWPAPPWLGAWPAVALYVVFLWLETVWEGGEAPRNVALLAIGYSILTWGGMWAFGREKWLEHGEMFTRVFGVLARFAPLGLRFADRRIVSWELRPYAVGLLHREPVDFSELMLVLTILAAVSFDGFLETPAWAAVAEFLGGEGTHAAVRTAARQAGAGRFFAVYLVFARLIAWSGRAGLPRDTDRNKETLRMAGLFALTLVPIAIAYLIAHYLSFLAIAFQYMIPIASDPLGWGWNLFGTATQLVRMGGVNARFVWTASLISIVAGHVAAVYLGHLLAMREFADRRSAARSQYPMVVLMVAYTMLSLWIVAQPIVKS